MFSLATWVSQEQLERRRVGCRGVHTQKGTISFSPFWTNFSNLLKGANAVANLSNGTKHEIPQTMMPIGRPCLNVLDQLTIELPTIWGPWKYQCGGTGCTKVWKPRTRACVLVHCKGCLKHTSTMWCLAASASAEQSLGALVSASSTSSLTAEPLQPECSQSKALVWPPTTQLMPVSTRAVAMPQNDSLFFGPQSHKQLHEALDFAIVKFICVGRLPPTLADLLEWKEMFMLQTPTYAPASRMKLMDSHIFSEQENVWALQIDELKKHQHLSVSFNRGSIRSGESLYTVHVTTPTHKVFLPEGQEGTGESHTGEWITNLVFRVCPLVLKFVHILNVAYRSSTWSASRGSLPLQPITQATHVSLARSLHLVFLTFSTYQILTTTSTIHGRTLQH